MGHISTGASLTARQREVLERLAKGDSEKEAAYALKLSPNTVHAHVKHIYRTFDLHSRAELLIALLDKNPTPIQMALNADRST